MSIFDPSPKFQPKVQPRVRPKVTVPSYIGEADLVGDWLSYNGAGGVLHDFSGEGNHGTLNGPKWSDERSAAWTLDFDGSDDYIKVPYDSVLDVHTFTILAWLYPRDISGENKIPVDFFSYQDYGYTLESPDASQAYRLHITWAGGDDAGAGNTNVVNDEWQMLGCAYDGGGPTANFYYDGSPDGSYTFSSDFDDVSGNLFYCIGKNQQGGWLFDGLFGIILHFTRVLTDSEVKQIHEVTKPLYMG